MTTITRIDPFRELASLFENFTEGSGKCIRRHAEGQEHDGKRSHMFRVQLRDAKTGQDHGGF